VVVVLELKILKNNHKKNVEERVEDLVKKVNHLTLLKNYNPKVGKIIDMIKIMI
jgi:hypothetical protein